MPENHDQIPDFRFEPIHKIPANQDAVNEGAMDPEPERGPKGAPRRKFWSWVKGWFTPA